MRDVELSVDRDGVVWSRRVTKAMRLASSLEVFDALLADQPVPVSTLDPEWRRRYAA